MFFKQIKSLFLELRLALSFLTLLPLAPKKTLEKAVIANSVAFFSFTGLLFSGLSFLCFLFYKMHEQAMVLAITVIIAHSLLSGGLHLDALMDSHDGLAVSDRSKDEIKRVMKDSRAGAFAVIALFLTLAAQIIFISQAQYQSSLYIYLLCLTPVLSRFLLSLELVFFVNEKKLDDNSSLHAFLGFNKLKVFLLNGLVLIALVYFYPLTKICIVIFAVMAFVFSVLLYRFLSYKLKGHNGDSLGCGLVLNESFIYFLIFAFSNS